MTSTDAVLMNFTFHHKKVFTRLKTEPLLQTIAHSTEITARNTEPKMSFHILLSEKGTRIRTRFNPLIELDKNKKYEMTLVNLETYYSWPNIDATNNNFRYSPDNGTTWFNLDVPEGCYEITDINEYVQCVMKENGHYDVQRDGYTIGLEANNNTLKTVLHVAENYVVEFTTTNSIRTVLGFNSQQYTTAGYKNRRIWSI